MALANLYHFITLRIALFDIFSSHELNFQPRITMSTIFIPFFEIFLVSIITRFSYSVLRHSERILYDNQFTHPSVFLDTAAFTILAMSFR